MLYSIIEELVNIYTYNEATGEYQTSSFTLQSGLSGLKSATIVGNDLYYSVYGSTSSSIQDGLYSCDLTTKKPTLLFPGSGFGALTSYGGMLYAVKENSVLQYSLENGVTKTDYEISSASDSVGRIANAKDSARAGNLLVTADSDNNRLSVYDMQKGTYTALPVTYSPSLVATDGEIIAAAAESTVYVYERDREGDFVLSYANAVKTTVSGIACLYGKCYFITYGYGYGVAGKDFNIEELCTREILSDRVPLAPAALTNDLYGNLYVVRSDGSVCRYTEKTFADRNVAQGESLSFTLPGDFSSVRADFKGNLYYLNGEKVLCCNGEPMASIDGQNFVYSKDGTAISPLTFALGFEDDSVYFNFGNFMVKTNEGALGFPTLRTIDAEGVYEELQTVHAPDAVRFTDVEQGAVGIKVDLSTLNGEEPYFPYTSYARTAESYRGVLLAEQGEFRLVALYHDRGYDVRLFRSEQCRDATVSAIELSGEKFLSSPCRLYSYPCIADAYAENLPRGTKVKLISVVQADEDKEQEPDRGYDFAYVEVETPARAVLRGYVPLSFLADVDPDRGEGESFEIVKLKEDTLFTDESGNERTLAAGTEVRLYTNEDGSYTGRYTDENGTTYAQTLTEEMIDRGESDALRIALIVILSVLALVIIGAYFALLPHEKKKRKIS